MAVAGDPTGIPVPKIDIDSSEWWDAVAAARLLQPCCSSCALKWFPPTPACPRCGCSEVELVPASGRGTVYSWVVVHRALSPAFAGAVPYVVLAVALEAGGRMFGLLRGSHEDPRLAAGARVSAEFYDVGTLRLVGFAFAT
jgi:uncharacterized OB-fold protein